MMRSGEVEFTLPGGYWHEGVRIRQVRVRAVAEEDVNVSDDLALLACSIDRVSALLARCVTNHEVPQENESWLSELSLGDREALLLEIRRLTFGDRIPCTLKCPSCLQMMDFELPARQLLLSIPESTPEFHEETFVVSVTRWLVRFRLPRASDLEAALVTNGASKPEEAASAVLRGCVDWVMRESEGLAPASEWPAGLEEQISARMAELDPQAEIALHLECPACQHGFSSTFDIADYFFRELESRQMQLLYDVHHLALAYHWSESDILRMTPRKRKLYLELLEEGFSSE
jgi:hypothetical protein